MIPFWSNDPTVLLNKDYILEVWPTPKMTYEEKLNAVSRMVIYLTILGVIITMSANILFVGIITLAVIFALYKMRKQKIVKNMLTKEGFEDNIQNDNNKNNKIVNPDTLEQFLKDDYELTGKRNPLGNVLLTQIHDAPQRKAAPPSFNPEVYQDITSATKKMIQTLNPDIKNTNKQLFGGLGEKFEFDQSMWHYYSMPNTKVVNDQGSFAQYLYGNMPSCRGGDSEACLKDNGRYNLY